LLWGSFFRASLIGRSSILVFAGIPIRRSLSIHQTFFQSNRTNSPSSPKADFIVTRHPAHKGLFLATGGSGHAYKFFPILGDKVVDALEGTLDRELAELWKWPAAMSKAEFDGTEDGSRSGQKGLLLMQELARTQKGRRGSVL
jgi:hypothetical protein